MAGDEKNLRETLGEVVKEGKTQTETTASVETKEDISKSSKTETNTGEPVYASGIDISDIPVEDRPRITEILEKKAKLLEKGYTEKFKEVASYKKAQDELTQAGLSVDEARDVLNKHIESKRQPTQTEKKEAKKLLDNLIENAPSYEQKESLRQLRQILAEETEVGPLMEKIAKMEQALNAVSFGYQETHKKEVNAQISELEKRYGKDLVEKYRDVIEDECSKYNVQPAQVLRFRATDDELEQAISKRKDKVKEKMNATASTGSGMAASSEAISTKGSFGDILRDVIKLKK